MCLQPRGKAAAAQAVREARRAAVAMGAPPDVYLHLPRRVGRAGEQRKVAGAYIEPVMPVSILPNPGDR